MDKNVRRIEMILYKSFLSAAHVSGVRFHKKIVRKTRDEFNTAQYFHISTKRNKWFYARDLRFTVPC